MFFDDSNKKRFKKSRHARGIPQQIIANSTVPPPKAYELMTFEELTQSTLTLMFDCEVYQNYFLAAFKCQASGKVWYWEQFDGTFFTQDIGILAFVLQRHKIVGFNTKKFDFPLIEYLIQKQPSTQMLKFAANKIINEGLTPYHFRKEFELNFREFNDIDLIEVAPLEASLKIYAGRLHCERMQDLPYPHEAFLSPDEIVNVRDYCVNDLDNTQLLFEFLKPQLDLREELGRDYRQNLMSKSDAQIAETVIASELRAAGGTAGRADWNLEFFHYKPPSFIRFQTPQFQHAFDVILKTPFYVGPNGSVDTPDALKELCPQLGRSRFQIGTGGLHSCEKSASFYSDDQFVLIDRDVASYYPNIILNLGLFPQHLGPLFLNVYRKIVQKRLWEKKTADAKEASGDPSAKRHKTASDALKIVINGGFGKFGSEFSRLYSPDLLLQVTLTGQLSLLMFIEMLQLSGFDVVSANTDGVVTRVDRNRIADFEKIVIYWEEETGFLTEETRYRSIHSRDVNNYIAIKEPSPGKNSMEIKTKGAYSEKGSALNSVLSKNPEALICSIAAQNYLAYGIPINETIAQCKDIKKFVVVKTVRGGGEHNGVYLGKAVRWYYAKDCYDTINYVGSGNQVGGSEGAKPLMILPNELPQDIDFDYYANKALDILYDVGALFKAQKNTLF